MQRIWVDITKDCDGNQLNYNKNLAAIGNKNYALQKSLKTDFFDSNRRRKIPTVIRHLLSSPRHPILHSKIFVFVQLFAQLFYRKIH